MEYPGKTSDQTQDEARLRFFYEAVAELDLLLARDATAKPDDTLIEALLRRLGARSAAVLSYANEVLSLESLHGTMEPSVADPPVEDPAFLQAIMSTSKPTWLSGPLADSARAAGLGTMWVPFIAEKTLLGGIILHFVEDAPEYDQFADAYLTRASNAIALSMRNQQLLTLLMNSLRSFEDKDRRIRQAYVDIFAAVTGGRLVLTSDDELFAELGRRLIPPTQIATPEDVSTARHFVVRVLAHVEPGCTIPDGFDVAFTEAMANAHKHGADATYAVYVADGGRVQVLVQDKGTGIDFSTLPRATLESGYSTVQTMGLGYTIMLNCSSRVLLATGKSGTNVLLEAHCNEAEEHCE